MKSHCASVTLRISARQRDHFRTGKKLLTFRKNRVPSASVSVPLNVALPGLKSMFFRSRLIFCMACKCSHFNTQLWSKLLHAIYYILQERSFGLNLFVNGMEHLPHGWNFGIPTTLPSPAYTTVIPHSDSRSDFSAYVTSCSIYYVSNHCVYWAIHDWQTDVWLLI